MLLFAGDGSVYSWGRGMFGRIGSGSEKDVLFPVQLNFGNPNPNGTQETVKIVGISAGAYHSLALAGYPILHTFQFPSFYIDIPMARLKCISLDAVSDVL